MNKCELCIVAYWSYDFSREHWFLYETDLPDAYYEEHDEGNLSKFNFCPTCGNVIIHA